MTRQVQPSRRRIIQFGILTSQGLQSAQMRRCKDLETPKKHYLSRSRRADFGRRWKTRTCRGRKYWRMIHRSKDIFRCECCFLNTSETISLSGDSPPSPREFCSVQYWPVHGAKDRSGEEKCYFYSPPKFSARTSKTTYIQPEAFLDDGEHWPAAAEEK